MRKMLPQERYSFRTFFYKDCKFRKYFKIYKRQKKKKNQKNKQTKNERKTARQLSGKMYFSNSHGFWQKTIRLGFFFWFIYAELKQLNLDEYRRL
jgi:hypothetical protein